MNNPLPHPLDSSLRWNDEDDTPVIPGEQRETRNPGFLLPRPRLPRALLWLPRQAISFLHQLFEL